MTTAEKTNWVKQRWDNARAVAKLTLIDKQTVYRHMKELLETEFKSNSSSVPILGVPSVSLLIACLNQNPEAIEQTRKLLVEKEQLPKIADTPSVKLPKPHQSSRQKPVTPADKLRVAMWYLNQFDDPQEALDALKLSMSAVEKLNAKFE